LYGEVTDLLDGECFFSFGAFGFVSVLISKVCTPILIKYTGLIQRKSKKAIYWKIDGLSMPDMGIIKGGDYPLKVVCFI
jgi:hypothetical protein